MGKLKIACVQTALQWRDAEENIKHFESLLSANTQADLWVLPEMFTTGFTMEPEDVAEPMNGKTHHWMQAQAKQLNAAICGSVIIEENGKYFNRFLFVTPSGETQFYDKRHLFTMAREHDRFSPGQGNTVVEWKGMKISLQVCYDLRFPVFARNTVDNPYDLLIYTANWPQARVGAWDKLLLARAIENQSFVVGVNRLGVDGKGIAYCGHSAVIDPYGEYIHAPHEKEAVIVTEIDQEQLQAFREKFPVLNDADGFELR